MCRRDAAIRRCWQEWMNNGILQRHDGSGRPRVTADRENRLIATVPDSSLSDIRRTNPVSDGVLMIIEDMSGDVQGSMLILLFAIALPTDPQPLVIICGAISFDSRTTLVVMTGHSGTSTTF
ncbi:hypothetical protein TNCV_3045921 [Trichonephila clavipes]|uniref:Uncharacterized protein n=1 Tax=Trichonephila clavipes TaxID=2585209 RepID=A0A8X6RIU6_TRICX|nr:hypothetical protein TNCV_3045921 [Trichonephila clavipes]